MKPREVCIPILYPRPTLLQVLAMETGRLALDTFGKATDSVSYVVTVHP